MASIKRADLLARNMFFVGLAGLPWLWCVNIFYFFDDVYGRIPCLWAVNNDSQSSDGRDESTGILGMMNASDDDDDDGTTNDNEESNINEPTEEEVHKEVCKWVKRSTFGAILFTAMLTSWIIIFQLNKDTFGPAWFIRYEDETGW